MMSTYPVHSIKDAIRRSSGYYANVRIGQGEEEGARKNEEGERIGDVWMYLDGDQVGPPHPSKRLDERSFATTLY